jgi:hypothetical protein
LVVERRGGDGGGGDDDRERLEGEVAACGGLRVLLLCQQGPEEAEDGVAVGEDADDVGVATDLAVEAFLGGVLDQILRQCSLGKAVKARSFSREASRSSAA